MQLVKLRNCGDGYRRADRGAWGTNTIRSHGHYLSAISGGFGVLGGACSIDVATDVATATFAVPHGLALGDQIRVTGSAVDTDLNADWVVATVADPVTVTFATTSVSDGTEADCVIRAEKYTLFPVRTGAVFSTESSWSPVEFILPTPKTGMWFTFVKSTTTIPIILRAPSGVKIHNGTAAKKFKNTTDEMGTCTVIGLDATNWAILFSKGTWSADNT